MLLSYDEVITIKRKYASLSLNMFRCYPQRQRYYEGPPYNAAPHADSATSSEPN